MTRYGIATDKGVSRIDSDEPRWVVYVDTAGEKGQLRERLVDVVFACRTEAQSYVDCAPHRHYLVIRRVEPGQDPYASEIRRDRDDAEARARDEHYEVALHRHLQGA